ncbi:MAG: hypothetical protein WAM39_14950 [Bryobacteraceae bacterium]
MSRLVLGCIMALLCYAQAAQSANFCLTTVPPSPAFQPPNPYRTMSIPGFWYGTAALWVHLPLDGRWHDLPFDGKSYSQKIFWFSRDYDWHKEPRPGIVVKSRRLDVLDGPTFTLEGGTNAILGNKQAMLTGAILPTTGCWEISGQYRGTTLTFVVSVER